MSRKWWLLLPAGLALWIAVDVAAPHRSSLAHFDGHEAGRMETGMWRSYYGHHSVQLFGELVGLLRHQYGMPFWRASLAAYHAARAAVVFQRGHNRGEYELALPNLQDYYALILRSSDRPFSADNAARLELEWWIVHRERAAHPPGDLEKALAALQATIYRCPESWFRDHARDRARAMLLRDTGEAAGGVTEQDWRTIGELLDSSWTSLAQTVAQKF